MKRSLGWRVALTLAVLIGSIAAYWWRGHEALKRSPTAPPDPTASDVLKNGLKLGLDLRGGIHLVMQVKTGDALRVEAQDAAEHLKDEARKRGVNIGTLPPATAEGFSIQLNDQTEPSKLKDLCKSALSQTDWQIDERGREWRVSLRTPAKMQIEDQSVRQAVETIRNRVDALGVTEPVIQRQSTDRILVQLPGVDDPSRVKEIIGTTGLLSLTLVDDKGGPYGSQEALLQAYGGTVPPELEVVEGFNEDSESRIRTPVFYGLKRAAAVTGRDLKNARVGHDKYNQAAVEFFLNAVGAEKFGRVTGENIGKRLAIVLEERTVGPSLGLDSIKQGVLASVVGMLLVFVAMVIYYRLAGVNAVVALLLNAIFLLGAMAWINATLTLPGIAGFILTIGMAVDSNVLIFERIREEIDGGKAPRNGVDVGFKKAFGTIIDTHVTTICAAAFLFQFGTGPVKGFAVTLVIGLLASVFTAMFVSHLLFDLIYGSKEKVEAISI